MSDAHSGFDPAIAHRFASLAAPAYFYDSFEPWAERQGFTFAQSFHESSIQAKLLEEPDRLLLVFTGTDTVNLREWFAFDFDLRHQPLRGLDPEAWVHKGFWRALHARNRQRERSLFQQVVEAVAARLTLSRKPLFVGGHSLGAAMASLFAAALVDAEESGEPQAVRSSDIASIYTTGEPRSGNAAYAAAMERVYGFRHQRGIFGRDWVPQMPFLKLGYRHHGIPHFIERDGTLLENTERFYRRISAADHLPQRYMRAYENILRSRRGESPIPIGLKGKQRWKDIYEVVVHPGRRKDK